MNRKPEDLPVMHILPVPSLWLRERGYPWMENGIPGPIFFGPGIFFASKTRKEVLQTVL